MARIRSIHPGQANDVDFTECSMPARLLAILLRNFADDNGVFVWREKQIKMDCFPADNIDVGPLLEELVANKQVKRFTKSGTDYGIFRNFRRWQRPEKPKTVHPIDDELLEYGGQSPSNRRPVADESSKVSADGKELELDKRRGKESKEDTPLTPQSLSDQSAIVSDDCVTAMATWNDLARECGLTVAQVLSEPRRKAIRRRLDECGGIEGWELALSKIRGSPFLLGKNEKGWRADIDFVLQAKSFTKLMEGSYDAKPTRTGSISESLAAADAVIDEFERREQASREGHHH